MNHTLPEVLDFKAVWVWTILAVSKKFRLFLAKPLRKCDHLGLIPVSVLQGDIRPRQSARADLDEHFMFIVCLANQLIKFLLIKFLLIKFLQQPLRVCLCLLGVCTFKRKPKGAPTMLESPQFRHMPMWVARRGGLLLAPCLCRPFLFCNGHPLQFGEEAGKQTNLEGTPANQTDVKGSPDIVQAWGTA